MKNLVLIMCLFMMQSVKADPPRVVEVTSTVKGTVLELEVTFDVEPPKKDAQAYAVTLTQMLYQIGVPETVNLARMKMTSFNLKEKKATLKVSGVPKKKLAVTGFTAKDIEDGVKSYVLTYSATPDQNVLAGAEEFVSTWESKFAFPKKAKVRDLTTVKGEQLKLIYKVKWE